MEGRRFGYGGVELSQCRVERGRRELLPDWGRVDVKFRLDGSRVVVTSKNFDPSGKA